MTGHRPTALAIAISAPAPTLPGGSRKDLGRRQFASRKAKAR
jgi:hypothetical protein